jgi:UDPglucose--hexose-1-phosphate uridylyltransferase
VTAPVSDAPTVELGAGVVRRASLLADGRELFYYDDGDTTLAPERARDERVLAPRPTTPHMRRDVLTGDWISVASARQQRVVLPPAEADPLAPQSFNPASEIPSEYDVAVFENRSPSFGPGVLDDAVPAAGTLGQMRESVGRCEVVCFSPAHEGSFGTQTPSRARTIIEAWVDRTRALSAVPGVEQVFVFENRGREIGVTLPHPHGQIYAYPFVTPVTRRMLESTERTGADLFARILDFEHAGPRVVLRGRLWTAFVPFAARWPVEVHIVPHRHMADLTETDEAERAELAPLYLRILRGLDALYDSALPYIAAWHQAPVRLGRDQLRLHLQLTSPRRAADKLKFLAGSEAAMGAWIGDVTPEDGAARLRDATARVDDGDAA